MHVCCVSVEGLFDQLSSFINQRGLFEALYLNASFSKHIDELVTSCPKSKVDLQSWSSNRRDWPRMDGFVIQTGLFLSNFKELTTTFRARMQMQPASVSQR